MSTQQPCGPHPPTRPRTPCDLLLSGGTLLDLTAPGGVADGDALAISRNEIVDVGYHRDLLTRWQPQEVIDTSGQYVASGFVDGHVHLSAHLGAGRPYRPAAGPGVFSGASRSADILPMIVRLCSAPVPDAVVAAAVRPVYAALLRSGFTGVVDAFSTGHRGLATAAADLGIRAAIGPCVADTWHDESGRLIRQADAAQVLAAAADTAVAVDGMAGGRVRALVSAIEPTACSDTLLRGLADLTRRLDLPTHVHTHISSASLEEHLREQGVTATTALLEAGLLTPRCTVMHAGCLTDEEVAVFARTGVTANHNPLGNAMLGFGTAAGRAVPQLLAAGVPVLLGSDYAPSMCATPFDLVRACLLLHREAAARDDAITLEQALTMAVDHGAALGQPGRLGRLAVGYVADVVCLSRTGAHHAGITHPVPGLALRARSADVRTTIVDGRVVVRDGHLVSDDEAELVGEAEAALALL